MSDKLVHLGTVLELIDAYEHDTDDISFTELRRLIIGLAEDPPEPTPGLLVNFFGGPGVGKSTMALATALELKLNQISVELVTEFAKDLALEGRMATLLKWQSYVTSKQYRNIQRALEAMQVVVTDSPILTGCFYKPDTYSNLFDQFWLERHNSMNTLNFHIIRDSSRPYDTVGRYQAEEEAHQIDSNISKFLNSNQIPYERLEGSVENVPYIMDQIRIRLGQECTLMQS